MASLARDQEVELENRGEILTASPALCLYSISFLRFSAKRVYVGLVLAEAAEEEELEEEMLIEHRTMYRTCSYVKKLMITRSWAGKQSARVSHRQHCASQDLNFGMPRNDRMKDMLD